MQELNIHAQPIPYMGPRTGRAHAISGGGCWAGPRPDLWQPPAELVGRTSGSPPAELVGLARAHVRNRSFACIYNIGMHEYGYVLYVNSYMDTRNHVPELRRLSPDKI